ncbi:hypothetical protein E2C01_069054 [Portunus trituberculatus]|uniref:Uncharacterized protein n=1 Tax=Portunus trituberculatus TaxID=210409 RepID=A0A5B7HTL9_PORTR|nr:hypothetical protein [Portunus trituberculatus]
MDRQTLARGFPMEARKAIGVDSGYRTLTALSTAAQTVKTRITARLIPVVGVIEAVVFLGGEGDLGTVSAHTVSSDGHGVGLDDAVSVPVSNVLDEEFLAFRGLPAGGGEEVR